MPAGIQELARRQKMFVAGDDFKSGQKKLKSVLVNFLVSTVIKVESVVFYQSTG